MTSERRVIRMELNRVEGDMEVRLELDGHTVTDAWCVGTMFRGFEQILVGPRSRRRAGHRPAHLRHLQHLAALRGGVGARDRLRRADRRQRHAHPQPLPDGRVGDERRAPHVPDVRAGLLQSRRTPTIRSTPGCSSCSSRRSRAASRAETVEHTKRILAIVIAFGGAVAALDLHDARRRHVRAGRGQARTSATPRSTPTRPGTSASVLGCTQRGVARARDRRGLRGAGWRCPRTATAALGVFARFGRSIGLRRARRGARRTC